MYSMMDVLFRLREGECNDWCAEVQNSVLVQLIYKRHNEGANLPLSFI